MLPPSLAAGMGPFMPKSLGYCIRPVQGRAELQTADLAVLFSKKQTGELFFSSLKRSKYART